MRKADGKKFQIKRWARIEADVMGSKAFEMLSAKGIRVYLRFLQKREFGKVKLHGKKQTVYNNGGLVFTYAEAADMGISVSQFSSILKRLHEVGLIDTEHQGGGLHRDYSRYALSERWRNFGTSSFHFLEKRLARKGGKDIRKIMSEKNTTPENAS